MKTCEPTLNIYGNAIGIPEGWHETTVPVRKLNAFNIPNYKAHIGWKKGGKRHINPLLVTIIPNNYKSVLTKKLKEEEKKKNDKQEEWKARLIHFTGCTEEQATHIASAIINKKNRERDVLLLNPYDFEGSLRLVELNKQLNGNGNPLDYIRSKKQALEIVAEYIK